jgi:peptide/nickel transport system permease protein
MIAFTIYRLFQAVPVLLAVGLIAFAMFAFVGDPVVIMLGQEQTEAQRAALTHQLGLDQPLLVQYAKFLWAMLHGNFGVSYRLARPVADLIAERLPATLELALVASALALLVGLPMGVYTAINRESGGFCEVARHRQGEPLRARPH